MLSGAHASTRMPDNKDSTARQRLLLAQAFIAALNVMMLGWLLAVGMSAKTLIAACHLLAFPCAVIALL